MTDAQQALAQVREALAAGPTPGPWYLRTNRHPTTDGRAWGWLDTQPPGGSQYAPPGLQITWERGSKSEANAGYIAACSPTNIAAILAHVEAQKAENEQLREMLARLYAGSDLYCDDGELQDARATPYIDFKRDSVAEIRCAMVERNERKKQRWSQQ